MKRLLVLLLLAGPVLAGPERKIEAPVAKVADKEYWTALAVLGAAKAADLITTERGMGRGCFESNGIYGYRPSTGRLVGVSAGYFVGEALLGYSLKRFGQLHPRFRRVWLIEPAYQTAEHVRFAYRNEGMACR